MQPLQAAVAPGVPVVFVTRPSPGPQAIERPALWRRLDGLVDTHRVTLVAAPAGYGKTTLLSTWAAHSTRAVAWLTLTEADRHADHLARGLEAALLALGPRTVGEGAEAVLVVDDVHLLADAARKALHPLIGLLDESPSALRLILSGRTTPPLGLARLTASGELGRLSVEDLSFTADEVDLAGRAAGHAISADRASRLHATTGGWPVAVRLALLATPAGIKALTPPVDGPTIPELPEYLIENVLDTLPTDLRSFVLPACTSDWLTGALAGELAGVPNGAEYLERTVAAGLPLERRGTFRGEPLYRWHPVMAQAGREILLRRDPERCRRLDLVAARNIGAQDTFAAAALALRGRDPEFAARLIRSQWLAAVLRGDSDQLAALCGDLPAPWSQDPEILAVLAACRRNAGDATSAHDLDQRAALAATALDPDRRRGFDLTQLLARLFVLDDAESLAPASRQALEQLSASDPPDGVLRACALLLIGWTELRLRHAQAALPVLADAARLCRAEGLDDLADRARGNHAFALAFVGDFTGAEAALAEASSGSATWRRTDGAIEWFTVGWIGYWTGDTSRAVDAFQKAVHQGGGLVSYAHLARLYLLHAAIDAGDPDLISRHEDLLDEVPEQTVQGLPWGIYRTVVRAGILLGRGRPGDATDLLDTVVSSEPVTPAAHAHAAELYWRCGRVDSARLQAAQLTGELPGYFAISGLVVRALCARHDDESTKAHELLEEALAVGARQGLLRPFSHQDAALADLLAEHAALGTRHEHFLAEALARQRAVAGRTTGTLLSARESEVLARLATRMSASEIAADLFISPNTLKSHVRSIYRKLGVETRRDAVRVALAQETAPRPGQRGR